MSVIPATSSYRGFAMPAHNVPDDEATMARAEQQAAAFREIEKPRVRVPAGRRVMEGRDG